MLLGVGAAVLPLVLHLLSRSRYKTVDWGGMLFLAMPGDLRQRRSARMHRWVLMLIRMGIIAALAVALARPALPGRWGAAAGPQGNRLAAAIILDCSGSMAFDENGVPRMDLARGAARQVLEALRPGDLAALIIAGAGPQRGGTDAHPGDLPLTTDLQAVADRVALAKPGTRKADFAAAIRTAIDQLQRAGEAVAGRDIYVICDRQKLSWEGARDPSFVSMWREQQGPDGLRARLMVIPVGSNDVQNVVIESIELQNAPAIRGEPAELEIRLRNDGPVQRASMPLTVKVSGGGKGYETKVDVGQDSTWSVKAPVKFDKAGSYVVTASVTSTGLTTDDSLDAAVEAVDPVKVLIISGDERPDAPFRSESDFLRVALAPFASAGVSTGAGDPCSVKVMPVEKWIDPQLSDYQVVVLANVEWLSPYQVRALEQFVYERGGGMLVTLGNLTRAEDYNDILYRFGAGLLPAELSPPTPADGSQATSLLGYRSEHPIFRFLKGRAGFLPSATVGRYFPVPARGDDPQATSLAEYLTGESFLVEKQFNKGKVLLLTTTIDADWTTLPLSNFYLPFMQSCIRYLAAPSVLRTNLQPGQPIRLAFPNDVERSATLTLPDGSTQPVPILRYGQQPEVNYLSTELPGHYVLHITEKDAPERIQHFVVRGPQQESKLEGMEEADWNALEQDLGLRRVESSRVPVSAELAAPRTGTELWTAALGTVLLLCILEMAVGRAAARDLA
jgi:hypothetical protein